MKIPAKPLLDHITKELDRLADKFPNLANALQSLKQRTTSRFQDESLDFNSVQDALEAIVKDADELDTDGYLYAIAQQLTNQLDALSRSLLSGDVPVLPELAVRLSLREEEAASRVEAGQPAPGGRTKLGGNPQWIQSDATPACSGCQKAMTIVAQIDSLSAEDSDLGRRLEARGSYLFGDVGMIYVFWCSQCMGTQAVFQCE